MKDLTSAGEEISPISQTCGESAARGNNLILLHDWIYQLSKIGVSVIIPAYDRKEFLIQAIKSVMDQSYGLQNLEIIVITNFSIDLVNFQEDIRLKLIVMDGTIGDFLYSGLLAAKYDIVAFLDDDDTFESSKLYRLMDIFSSNSKLCYYHNNVKYVDASLRSIAYTRLVDKKSQFLNEVSLTFDAKDNLNAIRAALEDRGDFNLSSIAIKRDYYLSYLPLLKQIKGNSDGFFFWVGLVGMGQLMIDNKKLTNYRIHEMNVSGQSNFISKSQELQRQVYTYDLILNLLEGSSISIEISERLKKWILLYKYEYELMYAIFSSSSKLIVMKQIKKLFSVGLKYSNTLKYRVLLFSIIGIVNENFAQKFYLRIRPKNFITINS